MHLWLLRARRPNKETREGFKWITTKPTSLNGNFPQSSCDKNTIFATQKNKISCPVSRRCPGKKLSKSFVSYGQPNRENGHIAEENQVSKTSSSKNNDYSEDLLHKTFTPLQSDLVLGNIEFLGCLFQGVCLGVSTDPVVAIGFLSTRNRPIINCDEVGWNSETPPQLTRDTPITEKGSCIGRYPTDSYRESFNQEFQTLTCVSGINLNSPLATESRARFAMWSHLTYHWAFTTGSIMSLERLKSD